MPLAVSCPECRYQFRVPDHVEGQRGKCPKCKATFLAMRETPTSDAAPATPAANDAPTANGPPAAVADTTSMKARTLSIPKPRLLEKLTPAPAAVELVDDAPQTPPAAPPPPPPAAAPPRGAPPKAAPAKAIAAAASPAIQLETAAPRASDAGVGGVYAHRRAKKSKLPLIIGIGTVLLLVVAAVGGGIGWNIYNKRPLVADQNRPNDAAGNTSSTDSADDRDAFGQPGSNQSPAPFQGELESWEKLRAAIVTIDVIDAGGTRSGTGWLLPGGMVATDFQTLHEADLATVTLSDGRRFDVAGVLQRPRLSLALLRLHAAPAELPSLALAEATPPLASGVFIGDAQAATPARVVRRVSISALPAAMRPRLPELMRDNDEIQLLEHDGRTSETSQGLTYETPGGAPLLGEDGRVVGVNLALGGDTRKGYAVGVELLQRLVAASAGEEFRPLHVGNVASVDPLIPLPENPFDEPADNPFDTPPASDDRLASSREKFGTLQAALAEKRWRPLSAADYYAFAEFANIVTELTSLYDELELAQDDTNRKMMVAAIDQLAESRWPTVDEVARVNELAIAELDSADSPGVFAYGRCIMRPEDFGDFSIDGLPLFAFELTGTKTLVVLPIGEMGSEIAPESEWLILGTKDLKDEVNIKNPEKPGDSRSAAIVRAKYILGRPTE